MTAPLKYAFLRGYELCRTVDDFVRCLRESSDAPERAEDYETRPAPDRMPHRYSALRPEQGALTCGIGLAWRRADGLLRSCYVGYRHDPRWTPFVQPDPEKVLEAYRDNCRTLPAHKLRVAHNGILVERAFDLREQVPWPLPGQGQDTMLAHRIANLGVGPRDQLGLKLLRAAYLKGQGYEEVKDEIDDWLKAHGFRPGADIWRAPVPLVGEYGAGDVCSTLELWERVKPLVYHPWQYPDEFGWWWERGHFDISGKVKPELADLYELEMESAYQALLAAQRGTRFDLKMAARRALGAQRLQRVCTDWVRQHVAALQEKVGPLGWICKGEGTDITKFNPNAPTQVKRLLFGDGETQAGLGIPVDTRYMSTKFNKMNGSAQEAIVADPVKVRQYAALSIDATKEYMKAHPEHKALLSVIGALRKMHTVLHWAKNIPDKFCLRAVSDRWWLEQPGDRPTHRIYHQLKTVQTVSGRMSSSDYNGQNVSADKALLVPKFVLDLIRTFLQESPGAWETVLEVLDLTKRGDADFGIRCEFLADEEHRGRPIDMSQIEVRIFAGLTGNKKLCRGYGTPPTAEQVATELKLIRAMGEETLDIDGYLSQCVLDPQRHWRGTPIDAHSLVTGMTTSAPEIAATGLSQEAYYDVLQLCASDEDRAILRTLEAQGKWKDEHGRTIRDIPREDLSLLIEALNAADRGDVTDFVKKLVIARKGKKSITFGIMYGMGVPKLARQLGLTIEAARDFLAQRYYAEFPEAKELPRQIEREIVKRANAENGYTGWMRHPAGRRFKFDVVYDHPPWAAGACPTKAKGKKPGPGVRPCSECRLTAKHSYVAVNRFIQGYAAALYKLGWVRGGQLLTLPRFGARKVDPITRRRYGPNWQDRSIHDETISMLHQEYDTALTDYCLRSVMTLATKVGVPLETSSERFVRSWADKTEVRYTSLHAQ